MKRTAKLLITLSLALAYGQAQATTYYLNQANTTPPFNDSVDYLTVDVNANGSAWDFTVTLLSSAFSGYPNAEIDQFAFNTDSGVTFSGLSAGWSGVYDANNNSMDGFGKFDAKLTYTGQSNVQTLSFTVTPNANYEFNSATPCGQGCNFFAAHVKQIATGTYDSNLNEITSAYFGGSSLTPTSVVPVPAAAWLLGSGLLGLVGIARRKAV